MALIRKYDVVDDTQHEEEVAFTCYNAAIAERERLTVPQLGLCTDRRCLRHIGEIFFETNMEVLMCFVCGGKHMKHSGCDKFGNLKEKGDLSIRTGQRELEKILIGRQTSSDETAWDYNMSYKFFKDRFGAAVQSDPELQRNSPEWFRKIN